MRARATRNTVNHLALLLALASAPLGVAAQSPTVASDSTGLLVYRFEETLHIWGNSHVQRYVELFRGTERRIYAKVNLIGRDQGAHCLVVHLPAGHYRFMSHLTYRATTVRNSALDFIFLVQPGRVLFLQERARNLTPPGPKDISITTEPLDSLRAGPSLERWLADRASPTPVTIYPRFLIGTVRTECPSLDEARAALAQIPPDSGA